MQKLTELGVDRIVLLHAERSVVRWDGDRAHRQLDRLRASPARRSMQSRRVWLPEVVGPVPLSRRAGRGTARRRRAGRPAPTVPRSDDLAIGPEGGWTADELALRHRPGRARRPRAARRDSGRRVGVSRAASPAPATLERTACASRLRSRTHPRVGYAGSRTTRWAGSQVGERSGDAR